MADVFISYARADWDHAKQLADALSARGYQVWWDVELVGSDNFRDVIMSELEAAKAVIVIWSASSCCSNFVLDEAGRALRTGKLVATRLDNFDPQNLPLGFGTQHTELVTQLDRISPALNKLGIDTTAKKSATEQARLLSETAFWDEIKDSDDPRDFKLYLNEYPDGLHRAPAKLHLRKLGADKSGLLKGAASLFSGKATRQATSGQAAGTAKKGMATTEPNSPPQTSRGFLALAISFVVFAVPVIIGIGNAYAYLNWSFLGSNFEHQLAIGILVGTGLVIAAALAILFLRGAALSNTERTLYVTGAIYIWLGPMFQIMGWDFFGEGSDGGYASGWLIGLGLFIAASLYLWLQPLRK